MAGSAQETVTNGAAVLLAAAPASLTPGQCGWAFISNGSGGKIWLGGSATVSATSGAGLAASTTLPVPLFPGDQVYGIADTASSVVGVLQTGA